MSDPSSTEANSMPASSSTAVADTGFPPMATNGWMRASKSAKLIGLRT